jgi:hypothetical protein
MTIRRHQVTVTITSGAEASGRTAQPVNGRFLGAHLQPVTYDPLLVTPGVTITTVDPGDLTLLDIAALDQANWYFPRIEVTDENGDSFTTELYEAAPVHGYLNVALANGDDTVTVVATILIEE